MSPASSCFSFETWSTTSPFRTVELLHLGSSRVEDTMYLGRLFNLCAHSPLRPDGHRAANHSSLRRPSSRASAPSASSVSSLAHASRSLPPNWPNQPPSLKPSLPSGSWTTPSSETFVLITIFPMSVLLLGWCCQLHRLGRRGVCANGQSPIANVPSRTSTVFVSLIRRRRAPEGRPRAGFRVDRSGPALVAMPLVVQAAQGQVDGGSRHPAGLVGSDEGRHVSHLPERHEPPRVGVRCEHIL